MTATLCPPLHERVSRPGKGPGLVLHTHSGQKAALASKARVVAVIAGTRSGKTALGPIWLYCEMRRQGPGDYLIAAPNFPLLDRAAGPEIEAFLGSMLGLGHLRRSPMQFVFSPQGCRRLGWGTPDRQPRIIFSHGDPYSLEAMTVKAAWLDEAGMPGFRLSSYEAVRQRVATDRGRILITTKPYTLGWLKTHVYDRARLVKKQVGPRSLSTRRQDGGGDIDVIQFGSAMNPAMPAEEIAEAQRTLLPWKFRMHWLGEFERPAGMVYECWDRAAHVVPSFRVPWNWLRYGGGDFGGVNTAAVILVKHPRTGIYYAQREYHQGGLTAAGHAEQLEELVLLGHDPLSGERPPEVKEWVAGSRSEDQWRREFAAAGIPMRAPPIKEVDVGIQRVHEMLVKGASNRGKGEPGGLKVMARCANLIEEFESYSYVVDDEGEPNTAEIANKEDFHLLDALRYICARLVGGSRQGKGVPSAREMGGAIYGGQRGRVRR